MRNAKIILTCGKQEEERAAIPAVHDALRESVQRLAQLSIDDEMFLDYKKA